MLWTTGLSALSPGICPEEACWVPASIAIVLIGASGESFEEFINGLLFNEVFAEGNTLMMKIPLKMDIQEITRAAYRIATMHIRSRALKIPARSEHIYSTPKLYRKKAL